jgi:glycosyltransferase involved in cell wall biosynthesis
LHEWNYAGGGGRVFNGVSKKEGMKNIKKSLLVDLSQLKNKYCGLWEVAYQFGQALIDRVNFNEWQVTFLLPKHHPFTSQNVRYKNVYGFHRFLLWLWRYDVVHGLVQNSPYLRCKNHSSKYMITLHDLNFIHENDNRNFDKRLRKYQRNVAGLDYLVCISHFVEQDVLKHVKLKGTKHSVIHNGVAQYKRDITFSPAKIPEKLGEKPYLLIVSTFMRKKNIHLLVDMMKFLPDYFLVVVGKVIHKDYYEEVLQAIRRDDLNHRIIMLGAIEEAEKYWLYDHCKAFVFPSAAEGFGIPPLEAMLAGKPVFASTSTSIPEVCGNMAFYWDTLQGKAMAEVVLQGLANVNAPQNNSELLKAYACKYSWQQCADKYIDVYNQLVNNKLNLFENEKMATKS